MKMCLSNSHHVELYLEHDDSMMMCLSKSQHDYSMTIESVAESLASAVLKGGRASRVKGRACVLVDISIA
jgi:hypothetical protein